MIVQWKYKVCRLFAVEGEDIVLGEYLDGYRGGRACPKGMHIYRPTQRRYDFVDYTGRGKHKDLEFCETTCILEMLGYIKFVGSSSGK